MARRVRSHPIRLKALSILNLRPASATQIAREIGESPNTVAYHVRVLLRAGDIELVEERRVSGGLEKVYRGVASPVLHLADVEALSDDENRHARDLSIEIAYGNVRRALDGGVITRHDTHISHSLWTFDEQGWREVYDTLREVLLEIAPRIQDESLVRLNADPDAPRLRAALNIQFYQAPPR